MITATEMLDEVAVLNRAGYTPAKDGQSITWFETLRRWCYRHRADVDLQTVHEAILDLCAERGSEHGAAFVNVGDLIGAITRIRRERVAAAEAGGKLVPRVDLPPAAWLAWQAMAHEAVAQGMPRLEAELAAYTKVGITAPHILSEVLPQQEQEALPRAVGDDPRVLAMAAQIGARP